MAGTDGFLRLDGRVAVVTGGARGIGLAICLRLARAGATVVVADRDLEGGKRAAADLQSHGGRAAAEAVDVTDSASVNALFERAIAAFGAVDILVNNAGITGRSVPVWELTDEDWRAVMHVDLDGVFYCSRAVVPHMRARGRGAIVNIASIAGKEGNPNLSAYSAAKSGVIALTKALGKEVIADGVRVNAVAPAVIETELLSQMTPATVEYLRGKIPLGRFGTVEEVAAVVHFLASDEASFVTAQCYDVSGGRATY